VWPQLDAVAQSRFLRDPASFSVTPMTNNDVKGNDREQAAELRLAAYAFSM
jgi:hypothetical protein